MRDNGPVSGREVPVGDNDELVSATDSRGVISFCNDSFCRIAGFDAEELRGQAHNIVRHPDMPAAVFELMWARLEAGEPWMGIVKNRCNNGDHYRVDAYETPLRSNGKINGYESVRVPARRDRIERAHANHAAMSMRRRRS